MDTLAAALRPHLDRMLFALAYNEFCASPLEEAVEDLIKQGATRITVATTMFTPGGYHSEIEIPETLARLRPRYPGTEIHCAWPFDLQLVAKTMAEQLRGWM